MKKKLIAAIVVLSIVLIMAMALLIYLELNQAEALTQETAEPMWDEVAETTLPQTGVPDTTAPSEMETTEPPTETPEQTAEPYEQGPTETEIAPTEEPATEPYGGEVILTPDNSETGTEETETTEWTEYAPPSGQDEDETPIL